MGLPIAIIAGGLGTRLAPITERVPKALVPINGRPFVDHQLELLATNGFTDIVLCVGYLGEMIEEHLGDGSAFGCRIAYSYDGSERIGTAGALAKALPLLGSRFFMTYGDSYLRCDYAAIEAAFIRSGKPAMMTVFRNDGYLAPSNVRYRDGIIQAYDKRHPSPDMQHIDYGLSLFERRVFEHVPTGQPTDLATVFQELVHERELAGYELLTRFYEVGTPEAIAETENYLRSFANPARSALSQP